MVLLISNPKRHCLPLAMLPHDFYGLLLRNVASTLCVQIDETCICDRTVRTIKVFPIGTTDVQCHHGGTLINSMMKRLLTNRDKVAARVLLIARTQKMDSVSELEIKADKHNDMPAPSLDASRCYACHHPTCIVKEKQVWIKVDTRSSAQTFFVVSLVARQSVTIMACR